MKLLKEIVALILFSHSCIAQVGEWTWIHGPQFNTNMNGNYGIKGISDINNIPPARYEAATWKDHNGNFWIFGGFKVNPNGGELNDLWMFSPITKIWTWVNGAELFVNQSGVFGTKGIPSALNYPSARGWGALTWTGSDGKLYLYGGGRFGGGDTDDLWSYDINTNEWTWLGGNNGLSSPAVHGTKGIPNSSNWPGGRGECKSTWTIGNELWFFGGMSISIVLNATWNDMWKYNIDTKLWTWVSGENIPNTMGNYGSIGVPSTSNSPSSRFSYVNWKDASNQLYIFSGACTDFFASGDMCNDICRYNTATNEWTWLKGNYTSPFTPAFVNQKCDNHIQNLPLGRYENSTPITNSECANAFWTFGGLNSKNIIGVDELKNDLWIYDATKNSFILAYGNQSGISIPANYGTKLASSPLNSIPPRFGTSAWTDKDENLWFFGGWTGGSVAFNDMWLFTVDTNCFNIKALNSGGSISNIDTTICKGEVFWYNNKAYSETGTYYDSVYSSGSSNCVNINIINLKVLEPQIDSQVISICNETTYTFNGHVYNHSGVYLDTIKGNNNCYTIMKTTLNINKIPIYIPNAFSPNGDNKNDCFHPIMQAVELKKYSFKIYNRFGQCMFQTKSLDKCWDGTFRNARSDLGVYFYILEAEIPNCPSILMKGDFTLLE